MSDISFHDIKSFFSLISRLKVEEKSSPGTTVIKQMSQVVQQTFLLQNSTMSGNNAAVLTPVELNKNLLNTLFKFNPLAKLKSFLIGKTGVEKTYYSLAEILTILKNIIRGEGMFDHANPSVILCSPELEQALNMRALHVTEIRDLVLSQITRVPDQSLRETFSQQINNCRGTPINISRTNLNLEVALTLGPYKPGAPRDTRIKIPTSVVAKATPDL
jgi:hypothetical protein